MFSVIYCQFQISILSFHSPRYILPLVLTMRLLPLDCPCSAAPPSIWMYPSFPVLQEKRNMRRRTQLNTSSDEHAQTNLKIADVVDILISQLIAAIVGTVYNKKNNTATNNDQWGQKSYWANYMTKEQTIHKKEQFSHWLSSISLLHCK